MCEYIKLDTIAANILYKIQDLVTNAMLQNEFEKGHFIKNETSMCNIIGNTIYNSFFFALDKYIALIYAKENKASQGFEAFFIYIFEIYYNNVAVPEELLAIIREQLQSEFNLIIPDLAMVDFICKKTIILVLSAIRKGQNSLHLHGIGVMMDTYGIDTLKSREIQEFLTTTLTKSYVTLGSLVMNVLVEEGIFNNVLESNFNPKRDTNHTDDITDLANDTQHVYKPDTYSQAADQKAFRSQYKYVLVSEWLLCLNASALACLPYLHKDNRNINAQNFALDQYILIDTTQAEELIHKNMTGVGTILEEGFLANPEVTLRRYSVDRVFLDETLFLVDQFSNRAFSDILPEEYHDLLLLLSLYDIDFKVYLTKNPEYSWLIQMLISFALELSEANLTVYEQALHDTFEDLINSNKYNNREKTESLLVQELKRIFDILRIKRTILIISLSTYIKFSCFNFVIPRVYFDFRGRVYELGLAFNLQSYKYQKALVKLYEIFENSHKNFIALRKAFVSILHDPEIKADIADIMADRETYTKLNEENIVHYLYSHCNPAKISPKTFQELLDNPPPMRILWHQLRRILLKAKHAFILTSYILLEKEHKIHNIPYSNHFIIDERSSAYIMSGVLFQDKVSGITGNLIGTGYIDLYQNLSDNGFKAFQEAMTIYTNIFNPNTVQTEKYSVHLLAKSQETFDVFSKKMCQKDINYSEILAPMSEDSYIMDYIDTLDKYIEPYSWLLFTKDLVFLEKNASYKSTLILGRAVVLKDIFIKNPWIDQALKERDLSKNIVMITVYGGTLQGRKDSYYSFFKGYCSGHGVCFNEPYYRTLLVQYIEAQYKIFREKFLPSADKLVEIGRKLSQKEKPIVIQNLNFKCELAPATFTYDTKIRLNTYKLGLKRKPYQLVLKKPQYKAFNALNKIETIINKRKQARLFPPDFIHSMDSVAVHYMLNDTYLLCKDLHEQNIMATFSLYLVHDCFANGRFLYTVLSKHLLDIIRRLYRYDYFNSIRSNFDSDVDFKKFLGEYKAADPFHVSEISNPNIFKHGE